jgi:AbrB family looped-hinge helix DNA binding protein
MDVTIQVRQRGVLTLPAELREQYNIQEGDTFSLVDLDGIFVLNTHDANGARTGTGDQTRPL